MSHYSIHLFAISYRLFKSIQFLLIPVKSNVLDLGGKSMVNIIMNIIYKSCIQYFLKRSHQNTLCKDLKDKCFVQGTPITKDIISLTKHTTGQWLGHDVMSSIIKTKVLLLRNKVNLEMPRIMDLIYGNELGVHRTSPIITADFAVEDTRTRQATFKVTQKFTGRCGARNQGYVFAQKYS